MGTSKGVHQERKVKAQSGYLMLLIILALFAAALALVIVTPLKVDP